jgi:hypothetical protein
MRRFAFLLSVAAFVACARTETDTIDTTAMGDTAMVPAPAPTPISLADIAGRWNVRSIAPGDTAPVTYVLTTTSSRSGWTITFPNRRPIPARVVAVAGDSIIIEAGPFESVRRPGVQVRSRQVLRIQDGQLVGTVEARYARGPDTLVYLRTEGTRVP